MNTPRTPREILLSRHASARPALDAQRDALLARFVADADAESATSDACASPRPPAHAHAALAPVSTIRALVGLLHRELFAPCRHAWSALACVWIALLAFQQLERLASHDFAPASLAHADPALLALWLEQRRLLVQLDARAGDTPSAPVAAPSPALPRPAPAAPPLGAFAPASQLSSVA